MNELAIVSSVLNIILLAPRIAGDVFEATVAVSEVAEFNVSGG